MTAVATPAVTAADPRLAVFCSPQGPGVFQSYVNQHDVCTADPYDVETIHQEARDVLRRMLQRAAQVAPQATGRILLLRGDAGSGKTHLFRAFRTLAHEERLAAVGYLQMTTTVSNYDRYLLANLLRSLEEPYHLPSGPATALQRLARAVLDLVPPAVAAPAERDRFAEVAPEDLPKLVYRYADAIVGTGRVRPEALNLVRALLFFQHPDPVRRSKVMAWLRCEPLNEYDRQQLGDLPPRNREEDARQTLVQLGRLLKDAQDLVLALCVDQVEDTAGSGQPADAFPQAINALIGVTEELPSAVVVIGCLKDHYARLRDKLVLTKRDRLERDPAPVDLRAARNAEEVQALVAKRLEALYAEAGLAWDAADPLYPFTPELLAPLTNQRTRDVVDALQNHRTKCQKAGRWVAPDWEQGAPDRTADDPTAAWLIRAGQVWNDFLAKYQGRPPEGEAERAGILAWGLERCSDELPAGCHLALTGEGRIRWVERHGPANAVDRLLVAVCEKHAKGGGLGKQVQEATETAGDVPAVIVRSTEFPTTPTAAVTRQLADLVTRGGRKVVLADTDWRTLLAFQEFYRLHHGKPTFLKWVRLGHPLTRLVNLRLILGLDGWPPAVPGPTPPPVKPSGVAKPVPPPTPPPSAPPPWLFFGTRSGLKAEAVGLAPNDLIRHAAFLGSSGSGKTTAALNLVEQLLARGVPAILIDRKGDLCRYADGAAWEEHLDDAELAQRRQILRERIDVALYTPGKADGRPLTLPLLPPGTAARAEAEREEVARIAAAALGGIIGYRGSRTDEQKQTVLLMALQTLAGQDAIPVTVGNLRQLIQERDDAFLARMAGGYPERVLEAAAQDLFTQENQRRHLLEGAGDQLDFDVLLGKGPHAGAGKTRLTIISTRFLGDTHAALFWVAQFLGALGQWMNRRPSQDLQAVVLLDEADQYLPAVGKPATKAPLDNLLRRARSAGLGFLLATQNPGDLDYRGRDNILTWVVGRVTQETAVNKLRVLFGEARGDPAGQLAKQDTGTFFLIRSPEVAAVRCPRNLIPTLQVPDEDILALARAGRPDGGGA